MSLPELDCERCGRRLHMDQRIGNFPVDRRGLELPGPFCFSLPRTFTAVGQSTDLGLDDLEGAVGLVGTQERRERLTVQDRVRDETAGVAWREAAGSERARRVFSVRTGNLESAARSLP